MIEGFNIVKQLYKKEDGTNYIYKVGSCVEVRGIDGFHSTGRIINIEDDYIVIKNKIAQLEIKLSNLLDIKNISPYK